MEANTNLAASFLASARLIKALLVGESMKRLSPALTPLVNARRVLPLALGEREVSEGIAEHHPDVILRCPSSSLDWRAEPEEAWPPALLCVTFEELESPALFEDADDFILAPATAAELDIRLRRLAVRSSQQSNGAGALQIGAIVLDPVTYEVRLNGQTVHLAWMEFQLLKFLMENPDKVFTREQLLSQVWGTDTFVGTRTVDVHIRRLRSKLTEGGECFRTVKNVGYGIVTPMK